MAIEARQLFNFIQGSDITGESAYDVWKRLGNEGSEADFLEFIRSGPKGENAHIYALAVSNPVMKKGANNALLPVNTTFTGFYRIGAEPTKYDFAGRFIIEETTNGTEWETKYTSEADEVSVVYTPSSSDVKIIKCTLYAAGGTTTEIDTQTCVILEDVAGLKVGARNLLSNSDIRYTFTKDSSETIDSISIVNNFDLQRLVNETVTLSFYADTMGGYTNADDGASETSNKFGMIAKLAWSDSTGAMPDKLIETPLEINGIGCNKERIYAIHKLEAPVGYDTIDSFTFDITLTMKPAEDNDCTWVFERPKLEVGNLPTEWLAAPEDVESKLVQADWYQNDSSAKDYIKNRTHYTEPKLESVMPETNNDIYQEIETNNNMSLDSTQVVNKIVLDKAYIVTVDGVKYRCIAYKSIDSYYDSYNTLGDSRLTMALDTEGNEVSNTSHPEDVPFCIQYRLEDDGGIGLTWFHKYYFNYPDSETHTIKIEAETDEVTYHTLDEKFIPDTIARTDYVDEKIAEIAAQSSSKSQLYFILKDIKTGCDHIVEMEDGTLTSYCVCKQIHIDTFPDKLVYAEGEAFDPTGMVVTSIGLDGSSRELDNYTYSDIVDGVVTITYTEAGEEYTAIINLSLVSELQDLLVDFYYEFSTNENGDIAVITEWKDTLNGEPSTECVIPNHERIKVQFS